MITPRGHFQDPQLAFSILGTLGVLDVDFFLTDDRHIFRSPAVVTISVCEGER